MSALSHDDVLALLPDLALGLLPADEAHRVMDVVRASPALQRELAALRGAAGSLAAAAPEAAMSAARKVALRDRLVTRAAGSVVADATGTVETETPTSSIVIPESPSPSLRLERGGRAAEPARDERSGAAASLPPKQSNPWTLVPWLWVAASAAFAFVQFQQIGVLSRQRDAAQVALQSATAARTKLANQLASRDSLLETLTGAKVRVVDMVATTNMAPGCRMFWDRQTNRWTLITHDLPRVAKGRTYQLWLVTAASQKISAATFNTDARGNAVVQATYPLGENDLAAVAITEEPDGGSPQPTGTILVAGSPTK